MRGIQLTASVSDGLGLVPETTEHKANYERLKGIARDLGVDVDGPSEFEDALAALCADEQERGYRAGMTVAARMMHDLSVSIEW